MDCITRKNSSALIINGIYVDTDVVRNVTSFLAENEQYGDDWSYEIENLTALIEALDSLC